MGKAKPMEATASRKLRRVIRRFIRFCAGSRQAIARLAEVKPLGNAASAVRGILMSFAMKLQERIRDY
jgi:hypothetical protein